MSFYYVMDVLEHGGDDSLDQVKKASSVDTEWAAAFDSPSSDKVAILLAQYAIAWLRQPDIPIGTCIENRLCRIKRVLGALATLLTYVCKTTVGLNTYVLGLSDLDSLLIAPNMPLRLSEGQAG